MTFGCKVMPFVSCVNVEVYLHVCKFDVLIVERRGNFQMAEGENKLCLGEWGKEMRRGWMLACSEKRKRVNEREREKERDRERGRE